ncbi:MAG: thermosome subunit alpha [Thermoplasmata archaeon]
MPDGKQPIVVLSENTERERGKDAQKDNINAAKAVADAVKATLGPKGMDKMLVDSIGDVIITNDGVTMLKEMDLEHPAANMVVEVAETQEDECGDGTTSAVILAGELLKRSEDLLDKDVHPSTIAKGYRLAANKSQEILEDVKKEIGEKDRNILTDVALTAMTGKSVDMDKERLAKIVVEAAERVGSGEKGNDSIDVDNVKVVKKAGSSVDKTALIDGIILEKSRPHEGMPKEVNDAKIALINSPIEVQDTETDAEVKITNTGQMQEFLDREEEALKSMVDTLKGLGVNVVFCQKGIDDLAQYYFVKNDIMALRRIKKSDMKKLSRVSGASIVNNLNDISEEELGQAKNVKEKSVSGSDLVFVSGVKDGRSVSILLRGGTEHVVDEVERSIHDALKVVAVAMEDKAVLPGGGAAHVELKQQLQKYAATIEGREQLAVKAFADSLNVIPRTLAENAGLDGIDLLMELNSVHEKEANKYHGIDLETEQVTDMFDRNIVEPLRVTEQAIQSATEVTDMILLIDDILASKGGEEEGQAPTSPQGMPPGLM